MIKQYSNEIAEQGFKELGEKALAETARKTSAISKYLNKWNVLISTFLFIGELVYISVKWKRGRLNDH